LNSVDEETQMIDRMLSAERDGATEQHPLLRACILDEHGPTHVDALAHIDPKQSDRTIDEHDLDYFYGEAVGLDVSHVSPDEFITVNDITAELHENSLEIREGDIVTLHTGHRERYYSTDNIEKKYEYMYNYTGLSREAAYWLGEQGIVNIGIDAPSIDQAESMIEHKEYPAHDMCAEYEVLNMENMANLDAVAGTRYTLSAFPIKLKDGTGAPIRPVAIVER
jgi:kynurenine formamidase